MTKDNLQNIARDIYSDSRRQFCDSLDHRKSSGLSFEDNVRVPPEGVDYDRWCSLVGTALRVNTVAVRKMYAGSVELNFHKNYYIDDDVNGLDVDKVTENYPLMSVAALMVREFCEVDPERTNGIQLRLKQTDGRIDKDVEEKMKRYRNYECNLAEQLVNSGQVGTLDEARVLVSVASGVFFECSNLIESADRTQEVRFGVSNEDLLKYIQFAKKTYSGGCSWCEVTMVNIDGKERSIADVLMFGNGDEVNQIRFGDVDLYGNYSEKQFVSVLKEGRKNKPKRSPEY
ncbi:MAG TPA: hypothetical protein PK370_03370 [Candidatus Woesebacteria bacterium]|nr:hypothetical protein [Candidatus Woesebacteria bacterium]HPJ17154.1 hypothetical protein [Candidatus Woesebacteria bacterium]